jgi:protein SCO1
MALAKRLFGRVLMGGLVCCCAYANGVTLQQSDDRREQTYSKESQGYRSQPPSAASERQPEHSLRTRIPDLVLLNQDGQRVNFYSDLIKGKVVVINFFFSSCQFVCPMQGEAFSKLQRAFGNRLGKDVFLISITSDPLTDTPERLKAWGARFAAKPGWTLLTGDEKTIHNLLVLLTGYIPGRGEHTPMLLILNDETGKWIREYGLTAPERVIALVDDKTKESLQK